METKGQMYVALALDLIMKSVPGMERGTIKMPLLVVPSTKLLNFLNFERLEPPPQSS